MKTVNRNLSKRQYVVIGIFVVVGVVYLLKLFSLASRVSDSSTLKALNMLLDNYDDVMVGFELKK